MDIGSKEGEADSSAATDQRVELAVDAPDNAEWSGYPQSLFSNWTPSQVKKSGIANAIKVKHEGSGCVIYYLDVNNNGVFQQQGAKTSKVTPEAAWEVMQAKVSNFFYQMSQ